MQIKSISMWGLYLCCVCLCSVCLPHGAVGWSAVCNCGVYLGQIKNKCVSGNGSV